MGLRWRTLRWGGEPRLPGWAPLVLKSEDPFLAVDRQRCAQQKGQQDLMLLLLKMEEGTVSQGRQWPLEAGTGKEVDFTLDRPGGRKSCWTPRFEPSETHV